MILNLEQITHIIKHNPGRGIVLAGSEYNKNMRMHLYGERMAESAKSMKVIEGYEKPTLRELRVKYTRSNRDLFSRLSRPIDKVFSAKGGSVYYNLSEDQDRKARALATDARAGYSVKQWIENFWKPHLLDDPAGMIFMEVVGKDQAAKLKAQGKPLTYPTYKSISCVYDYLPMGANLEYVVFNITEDEKRQMGIATDLQVYRVVDDSKDYIVQRDGEIVRILDSYTLDNYFMKVPAILNSDIPNPNCDGQMLSPFDEVLELADQFLLKGSIRVTHDFLHGFPKYWEYADSCLTCNGDGLKDGADCKDCKGTGKKVMTRVSDVKLLTHPQTKEDAIITPDVAGYVSPDKTYWEISTADLQMLEDLMNFTLWGANPMPRTQGMQTDEKGGQKTATEIMTDTKPQSDRLVPYSVSAAKRDKFIRDHQVQVNINQNYVGSSVNYGKRYMLEGPDVLFEKYSKARLEGVAASVMDDLLLEYYEAKYDSDPVKLAIQVKLMKVEPFVHHKVSDVKLLAPAEEDFKAKMYFSEWLSTINDAMILSMPADLLRENLYKTTNAKKLPEPETAKPKPV